MFRRPLRLLPGLMASLSAFASVTGAEAQPTAPGFVLKLDGQLGEGRLSATELPAFGRAWIVEGHTEEQTTLIGDAEVRRAGSVIRGDRITYTPSTDELVATGNVRVTREGNVFTGPALRLRIDANEGTFTSPDYYLALQGGGRGHAERIDFLGPGRVLAARATFTTCGPETPDWQI